ncbi:MAG TPA: 2-oxo-4-hydroxy-4-carboxy-5-ureidoimidazoline decarboxylase [Aestuariivirga sp.]
MNLTEANAAGASAFADIAEHSSWVAEVAFKHAPFKDREDMIQRFAAAVMAANRPAQLKLLNAHPDLATRAKLTEDSTKEQMGVGLDSLSSAEFAHFTKLNEAYRAKNGFPFIFAVKGATKDQILAGFESRIENNTAKEFETALEQVSRIIRFRLEERVAP